MSRRLGRPKLYSEPSTTISATVPVSVVDALCAIAARERSTLSRVTARVLMIGLHPRPASTPADAHPAHPAAHPLIDRSR